MAVEVREIDYRIEEINSKGLEINSGAETMTVQTEAMSVTDKEINSETETMSVMGLEIDSTIKALLINKSKTISSG